MPFYPEKKYKKGKTQKASLSAKFSVIKVAWQYERIGKSTYTGVIPILTIQTNNYLILLLFSMLSLFRNGVNKVNCLIYLVLSAIIQAISKIGRKTTSPYFLLC